MEIRLVRPPELSALGAITVAAYTALPGHIDEPDYEAELADVGPRAEVATVLVAVEGSVVLGGVTFVPNDHNPMAEHGVGGAASIRMLAVAGTAQGRGVGQALVEACLDQARAAGTKEVVLHSTEWMATAHRLYRRLGFLRAVELDGEPVPGVRLLGFRRTLED